MKKKIYLVVSATALCIACIFILCFKTFYSSNDDSPQQVVKHTVDNTEEFVTDAGKRSSDTDAIPQNENDESFNDFILEFASNKEYQSARVLYPLEYIGIGNDKSSLISESTYVYDSTFLFKGKYDGAFYKVTKGTTPINKYHDNEPNMRVTQWGLTGYSKTYYFTIQNHKWYLNRVVEQQAKQQNQNDAKSDENFEQFIYQFQSDLKFQLARVKFPLQYVYNEPEEKIYRDVLLEQYQEESILVGDVTEKIAFFSIQPQNNANYRFEVNGSVDKYVIVAWGMTDYYCEYFFEKLHGLWYLTKVVSDDPAPSTT